MPMALSPDQGTCTWPGAAVPGWWLSPLTGGGIGHRTRVPVASMAHLNTGRLRGWLVQRPTARTLLLCSLCWLAVWGGISATTIPTAHCNGASLPTSRVLAASLGGGQLYRYRRRHHHADAGASSSPRCPHAPGTGITALALQPRGRPCICSVSSMPRRTVAVRCGQWRYGAAANAAHAAYPAGKHCVGPTLHLSPDGRWLYQRAQQPYRGWLCCDGGILAVAGGHWPVQSQPGFCLTEQGQHLLVAGPDQLRRGLCSGGATAPR